MFAPIVTTSNHTVETKRAYDIHILGNCALRRQQNNCVFVVAMQTNA